MNLTPKETIIQAARTWAQDILGLDPLQVVPIARDADQGPPPDFETYIVVNVPRLDGDIATPGDRFVAPGIRQRRVIRSGTLSLIGIGPDASPLLTQLALYASDFPDVATLTRVLNHTDVTVETEDGVLETRHLLDFNIEYGLVNETPQPAAETYRVTTDLGSIETTTEGDI